MGSHGSTWVKGTPVPSVFALLLLIHSGYEFLETTVVANHGGLVTTLQGAKASGSRTCTPASIPVPSTSKKYPASM